MTPKKRCCRCDRRIERGKYCPEHRKQARREAWHRWYYSKGRLKRGKMTKKVNE